MAGRDRHPEKSYVESSGAALHRLRPPGRCALAEIPLIERTMPADDARAASDGGAFFGRRKGRPLRPRQAALIEHLLPRLALALDRPAPDELKALFARPLEAVRLEIGFGGGEH